MELWKQPISFSANRSDIPPYPVLCLPDPIRSMAEMAKEFGPAIPATYYLTVCSSLFSNLFEVSCFGDTVQLNLFSFIFENPAVKGFITRSYCNARELFQKKYGNFSIPFKNANIVDDMDLPIISLNYFQDFWGDILLHEKSCELLFAVPAQDMGFIHERDLDEGGQFRRLFERTLYNKIYGNRNCRILTLSDDAAKLFSDYCATNIYPRLKIEFEVCHEWCKNYPKLILKLCGLIHCIAYSNAAADPAAMINGMTMTAALQLTPLEFSVLWYLCDNQGRVVPSEELFEAVWGEKYLNSNNTVMAHIGRLREKLHEPARSPKFIKTVWGVGYTVE